MKPNANKIKQNQTGADMKAPLTTSPVRTEDVSASKDWVPAQHSPWVLVKRHRISVVWLNTPDNLFFFKIRELLCMYCYAIPINFNMVLRKYVVYQSHHHQKAPFPKHKFSKSYL